MKLPNSAHTSQPWRISTIATDFELEDVWALPTPGGPDDFDRLVRVFTAFGEADFPLPVRALFAVRWQLGRVLGWDGADSAVGRRVPSLRDRLPADLRDGPRGPDLRAVPSRRETQGPPVFSAVYLTDDEWVAEIANSTVHGLLHLGWVPDESGLVRRGGGYRGQMAVLVKPAGRLGRAYLLGIKPFRLAVVYPLLLRAIGQRWRHETVSASEKGSRP